MRNPIISTILYVTAGDESSDGGTLSETTGGPSLVTNQKLSDSRLATKGWMSHPKSQRLVAFDGRYLHGVVPGKGVRPANKRRVTLMFALWDDVKIRRGLGPGSARPFPMNKSNINNALPQWTSQLVAPLDGDNEEQYSSCVETAPIRLDTVYETLEGKPWKKGMGMPSYDQVFQGF